MVTTNLLAVNARNGAAEPASPQRPESDRLTSFRQSLLAARENLRRQQANPPGEKLGTPQTSQTSPALSTVVASQTAVQAATPQLPSSFKAVATVKASALSHRPASGVHATLTSKLYQPLPSSVVTVFDRLRQRNEIIKQRLMQASAQASVPYAKGTPGLSGLFQSRPTASKTAPVSPLTGPEASRPATWPTGRPMALAEYPRPPQDNGRGMHWIPTLRSDRATVDRFVREMVEMKMKWAVILNDDTNVGDNDYLVQQLVANGIMPIMRVYTPNGRPIQGDLGALVRHYKPMGVHYYQLYNEPNLDAENEWQPPNPNRYVDLWTAAAKQVIEAGGLPGFGSLAPGGNFDDIEFLKQALDAVEARGQTSLFDRAWIGLHNYTLNHPLDYVKDSNGFLKFRWYDEIVRQKLGRSLPIISTEGGTHVGVDCDKTMPAITEDKQVEMVVDAYDYMKKAEPYYLAYNYWIIANEAGGGADKGFEWQALFQNNRTSPVVAALKNLPDSPRATPNQSAAARLSPALSGEGRRLVEEASKYLGKPYVWGGHSPATGFDCTGFTWYVMKQLGRNLAQHDLEGQMRSGQRVARNELQPGDFVFFQNTYRPGLSHVGIYAGDDRFIHAASERLGVIVSSLGDPYWSSRYIGATRVLA